MLRNSKANIVAFLDMRARSLVASYRRFGRTCCPSICRIEEDVIMTDT
jgi:hypothetical protein